MEATPVVVATSTVSGNIGSCEAKSTDADVNSFHTRTVIVNSCTGQVLGDYTYFDWTGMFLFGLLILFMLGLWFFIQLIES